MYIHLNVYDICMILLVFYISMKAGAAGAATGAGRHPAPNGAAASMPVYTYKTCIRICI